jgi:dihydropteroate synthase
VIGEVLDVPNPADRDAGTVACIVQGMLRGAHILRVHNVRAAVQTVRTIAAVEAAL